MKFSCEFTKRFESLIEHAFMVQMLPEGSTQNTGKLSFQCTDIGMLNLSSVNIKTILSYVVIGHLHDRGHQVLDEEVGCS